MIQFLKSLIINSYVPLKIVQEIKFHLYLSFLRWNNKFNPLMILKRKRLESLFDIKLNFGCGGKILDGWINIDACFLKGVDYVTDLRTRLPFKNSSIVRIYTEHVLEHLDFYKDIPVILNEFYRVLQPDGVIRIVVPDLEKYCTAYINNDLTWFKNVFPGCTGRAQGINSIFLDHFHCFIFDLETLTDCLSKAGFTEIRKKPYGISDYPKFNEIDTKSESREYESLCVEAKK